MFPHHTRIRVDGELSASYTVMITNGRLTERAEFWLSPQVMRTLERGHAPTDEQVRHEITQHVR